MKEIVEEKHINLISYLQKDFLKLFALYFQQSNLSFTRFAELWRQQQLHYLHLMCPEKLQYHSYLQILYYVLLKWLFLDYSQHGTILKNTEFPLLTNIYERPLRLLVGNIPIVYSIYILFQTQLVYRNPNKDFYPIRFDKLTLEYVELTVHTLKTTLSPTIGITLEALWKTLKEPSFPHTNSHILLCEYTGPLSMQFCAMAKNRVTLFSVPHWTTAIYTHQVAYTEYLQHTFRYEESEPLEVSMSDNTTQTIILPSATSTTSTTLSTVPTTLTTTSPLFHQIHSLSKDVLTEILQSIQSRRQARMSSLEQKQQQKERRLQKQQTRMKAMIYPTKTRKATISSEDMIDIQRDRDEQMDTASTPVVHSSMNNHMFLTIADKKRKLRDREVDADEEDTNGIRTEQRQKRQEDMIQYIPLPSMEEQEGRNEDEDNEDEAEDAEAVNTMIGHSHNNERTNQFWDDFKEFVGISVGPKLVSTMTERDILPSSSSGQRVNTGKSSYQFPATTTSSSRRTTTSTSAKGHAESNTRAATISIDEDDCRLADEILHSLHTQQQKQQSQQSVMTANKMSRTVTAPSSSSSSNSHSAQQIDQPTNEHERMLLELEAQIMSIISPTATSAPTTTTAATTTTSNNHYDSISNDMIAKKAQGKKNTSMKATKATSKKSTLTAAKTTTKSPVTVKTSLVPLQYPLQPLYDTSDSEDEEAMLNRLFPPLSTQILSQSSSSSSSAVRQNTISSSSNQQIISSTTAMATATATATATDDLVGVQDAEQLLLELEAHVASILAPTMNSHSSSERDSSEGVNTVPLITTTTSSSSSRRSNPTTSTTTQVIPPNTNTSEKTRTVSSKKTKDGNTTERKKQSRVRTVKRNDNIMVPSNPVGVIESAQQSLESSPPLSSGIVETSTNHNSNGVTEAEALLAALEQEIASVYHT